MFSSENIKSLISKLTVSSIEKDNTQKIPLHDGFKSSTLKLTLSSEEKDECPPHDGSGENDSAHASAEFQDAACERSSPEEFKSPFDSEGKLSPLNLPKTSSSDPSQHCNLELSIEEANEPPRSESSRRIGSQLITPRGNRNDPQREQRERSQSDVSQRTLRRRAAQNGENIRLFSSSKRFIFNLMLHLVRYNTETNQLNEPPTASKCTLWFQFCLDGLKTWWMIFAIFSASIAFTFIQPSLDESRSEFVPRDYSDVSETTCNRYDDFLPLCLAPNETSFLNGEHLNRFVWTLHSIIAEDGCQDLDRYNIATDFENDRPVIEDDIISDSLMRYFNYTTDEARILIKTCRIVFEKSYLDVVSVRYRSFIYLNDYLLKYCGFKTNFVKDMYVFFVLFVLFYLPYQLVRWIIVKKTDKLLRWYHITCIQTNGEELEFF